MPRDINLGPTGGPFINLQENNGDLDISNATTVDLHGATLTNADVGGFDSISVFESDGTFDASGVDTAFVEVIGGGGGGGYRGAPSGSYTDMPGSGGGGGGGYFAGYIDISTTSSVSVTVGDGGSGGTASNPTGGLGEISRFGSFIQAGGGGGGMPAVEGETIAEGGAPGTEGSGEVGIKQTGGRGGTGYTDGSIVVAGAGGSSQYCEPVKLNDKNIASTNPDNTFITNIQGPGGGGPGMTSNETSAFGQSGAVFVRYKA